VPPQELNTALQQEMIILVFWHSFTIIFQRPVAHKERSADFLEAAQLSLIGSGFFWIKVWDGKALQHVLRPCWAQGVLRWFAASELQGLSLGRGPFVPTTAHVWRSLQVWDLPICSSHKQLNSVVVGVKRPLWVDNARFGGCPGHLLQRCYKSCASKSSWCFQFSARTGAMSTTVSGPFLTIPCSWLNSS